MRTTFLLQKKQCDGSICLSVASLEEWRTVVQANKNLPADQKRYFIFDYIFELDETDRMVIEVPVDEYRKWSKDRMAAKRNRAYGKNFQHLSLEAPAAEEDYLICLGDTVASGDHVEDTVCDQMLIDALRVELGKWRPWANDLLDFYLRGKSRTCTAAISEKYGVSLQVVRKYKRQFEDFIKKFLTGVSF